VCRVVQNVYVHRCWVQTSVSCCTECPRAPVLSADKCVMLYRMSACTGAECRQVCRVVQNVRMHRCWVQTCVMLYRMSTCTGAECRHVSCCTECPRALVLCVLCCTECPHAPVLSADMYHVVQNVHVHWCCVCCVVQNVHVHRCWVQTCIMLCRMSACTGAVCVVLYRMSTCTGAECRHVSCCTECPRALVLCVSCCTECPRAPVLSADKCVVSSDRAHISIQYNETVRVRSLRLLYKAAMDKALSEKCWDSVDITDVSHGSADVTLNSLQRGTMYRAYAVASNDVGDSLPSDELWFHTVDCEHVDVRVVSKWIMFSCSFPRRNSTCRSRDFCTLYLYLSGTYLFQLLVLVLGSEWSTYHYFKFFRHFNFLNFVFKTLA